MQVFALVHDALMTAAISKGFGRHMLWLSPNEMSGSLKYGIIAIGPAILVPAAARVSFCVTLLYLVDTDIKLKRWPLYYCIAGQITINLAGVILYVSRS